MNRFLRARRALTGAVLLTSMVATASAQGLFVGPDPQRPDPQQVAPQPGRPTIPNVADTRTGVFLGDIRVKVALEDGVAVTTIEQAVHNQTRRPQEATWILPLPEGAIADKFAMTVGGVPMKGEVLDAGQARATYEAIVRRQRDPGLLEYMGQGCLRARVFPIPAEGKIDVVVRFSQVLTRRGSVYTWAFPIRASAMGNGWQGRLSVDATIQTQRTLHNVYSPLPGVDIVRDGDKKARLSLELAAGQIPGRDLVVHYGLSDDAFGLDLLTYKDGDEGYFMMLVDPKRDWPDAKAVRRSVSFVVDTSGSMAGEKMTQATGALRQFLQSLDAREYFNVVPFSTTADPFFPEPVLAEAANIEKAMARLAQLEARGGTNIEEALTLALERALPDCTKGPDATPVLPITVFLTDGLPTVGNTNVDQLLAGLNKTNDDHSRLFVFGVGDDVNTRLLDTLAKEHRGDKDYVRPGEDIELATGALFAKIKGPVMTDVTLRCDGITGSEIFPRQTPDLFMGGQMLLVGRYKGEGHHAIRLKGMVQGVEREYVYERTFPAKDTRHDFIPTLWAQRKIAMLLESVRAQGQNPELIAEIRRLGTDHGVVTPFTSHLILEEGERLARHRGFVDSGSDDFFLGGARRRGQVLRELQRDGALPAPQADPSARAAGAAGGRSGPGAPSPFNSAAPGKALATAVKNEAIQSVAFAKDRSETGVTSVDKSVRLDRMASLAQAEASGSAIGLTHRRIGDRSFFLIGGVWVQKGLTAELEAKIEKVTAFSPAWFELAKDPSLAKILAFSTHMVLLLDGRAIEIVDAADEPPPAEPVAPAQPAKASPAGGGGVPR